MKVDYDKLKSMVELYAKPAWDGQLNDWIMRKGGGETYIQEKILQHAIAQLKEDVLRSTPRDATFSAVMAPENNLLSQFEKMQSRVFIKQVPEDELRGNMVALLYGPEQLHLRLTRFVDWAKVRPVPGENKKSGFSPQVASYFLAMAMPRKYAFCKPSAYNSAVIALLGKEAKKTDPVERVIQCNELYTEILNFLEIEYGLEDGNLLDVHSLFYLFYDRNWETSEPLPGPIPTERPLYDYLMDKHNVVLYGPPGTGKTMEALRFREWWKRRFGPDSVAMITFHPSYCYEDFIEGFRPAEDGSSFQLRDGIFKSLCKKAIDLVEKKFLLIIDEINRGDVARILGELITLVEGDKRGALHTVLLQQSGEKFYVPTNLYLLGTMNTADKSISLMDLAIRRRFLFCPSLPNPDILDDGKLFHVEVEGIRLSGLLVSLNQHLIDVGIDRDRILGHSYFLIPKDVSAPVETLIQRMKFEIIPLVEEYCYSDKSLMKKVLGDLVDESGAADNELLGDPKGFVQAMKALIIE